MKLTVTVTDENRGQIVGDRDRDRVVITDTKGPGFVIAGMLRAIADDIDPEAGVRFEHRRYAQGEPIGPESGVVVHCSRGNNCIGGSGSGCCQGGAS